MTRPRSRVNFSDWEICLIKGLVDQGTSQQEIIARFSFPHRTVHHNLVSEIARRETCGSDVDYPPAPPSACQAFVDRSDGTYGDHLWALFVSDTPGHHPRSDTFSFAYRYHAVGQGMFCSGRFTRSGRPDFRWVFDCGTEHGQRSLKRREHVKREIGALRDEPPVAAGAAHLDLVTLSHFDEDHLSGLLDLLSEFTVGTLLLPYVTPWDRLIVALVEGAEVGDDLLDFLIEPTAFLLGRAGEGRIERILLVPGGGEGPALPPALPPDGRPPVEDIDVDRVPDVIVKAEEPPNEDGEGAAGPDGGLSSGRVQMLPRGGAITIGRAWEFVPYNDARLEGLADDDFKNAARTLAAKLSRSSADDERERALEELTELYDRTFKSAGAAKITPHRRNEISLFLYSGPIGRVELLGAEESIPRHRLSPLRIEGRFWTGGDRFGQMFTGDGFLKTDRQWHDFRTFYGAHSRLRRAAIFQVMHHGSKANWRDGLARAIAPRASIFCSDPAGKLGHPDWPVLKAFQDYNPKQVDLLHGWRLAGRYRFV